MTLRKYTVYGLVMLGALLCSHFSVYALTPKQQKGVKVLVAPNVVHEAPDRVAPISLSGAAEDFEFWQRVLPFTGERNAVRYIVIPTLGLIAPVQEVASGSTDYVDMLAGKEININAYLTSGVMHYPGTALPGQLGNIVIFGHSNFLKYGPGDYKTIFADLMNLDGGPYDEIRVYQKKYDGSYELFKYAIEQSYETHPQDVDILFPGSGEELTVFACTNGIQGRWIVKARRIPPDELFVPYELKFRLYEALQQLAAKDPVQQQNIRDEVLIALERKKVTSGLQKSSDMLSRRIYLLNYLEKKLLNF